MPFKRCFICNKNGEYSHSIRAVLTVFHVRFVFVQFETFRFCKAVRVVFPDLKWAREINPVQPLTVGIWNDNKKLNDIILMNSDIVTFHCYDTKEKTEIAMKGFLQQGRPVICTEWMNRVAKSKVRDILPVFKENHVGSMLWGLVNGKTQTHLCWGHRPEQLPYKGEWQHDLFTEDFKPYRTSEINLIRELTK